MPSDGYSHGTQTFEGMIRFNRVKWLHKTAHKTIFCLHELKAKKDVDEDKCFET